MAFITTTSLGFRPRAQTERIVKSPVTVPLRSKRMSSALLLNTSALVAASTMAWLTTQQMEALAWAVWPIVGSILASVVAILAPRKAESAWTTCGRFLGALVVGVVLPRIFALIHPALKEVTVDPILGIGVGFVAGLLGFTAIVVFIEKLYRQGPSISDAAIRSGKQVLVSRSDRKNRLP